VKKLLLVMQFWDGDKESAMRVARFIADLEPKHSEMADFLFVARFDALHHLETIQYVAKKFNVHSAVSKRRGIGWPGGCNDLFFGAMDWVYSQSVAKKIPEYRAAMMLEGDSCPLHPGWIRRLSEDWEAAKVKIYGPLIEKPLHVNGNCLVSCDLEFLKWLTREKGGCSPQGGWDYLLYRDFVRKGLANAPGMRSWWRVPEVTQGTYDQLLLEGVYFLHGIKNDSLSKLVRERFKV